MLIATLPKLLISPNRNQLLFPKLPPLQFAVVLDWLMWSFWKNVPASKTRISFKTQLTSWRTTIAIFRCSLLWLEVTSLKTKHRSISFDLYLFFTDNLKAHVVLLCQMEKQVKTINIAEDIFAQLLFAYSNYALYSTDPPGFFKHLLYDEPVPTNNHENVAVILQEDTKRRLKGYRGFAIWGGEKLPSIPWNLLAVSSNPPVVRLQFGCKTVLLEKQHH